MPPQAEAEPPPAQATQFDAGAAEPPVAEPPRRRSTVREPAPQAAPQDDGHLPAPSFTPPASTVEPVLTSSAESESSDRPRRSGWWSKRVLGKG